MGTQGGIEVHMEVRVQLGGERPDECVPVGHDPLISACTRGTTSLVGAALLSLLREAENPLPLALEGRPRPALLYKRRVTLNPNAMPSGRVVWIPSPCFSSCFLRVGSQHCGGGRRWRAYRRWGQKGERIAAVVL